MSQTVLVTGGAGYVGSHAVVALLERGYSVVVVDNLTNSSREALRRAEKIAGSSPVFIQGDIRDVSLLSTIFNEFDIDLVMHFAGLKSVGESVSRPLDYHEVNVAGTISLCQVMQSASVFNLVFSSSATVYGEPSSMPIRETFPTGKPTNPYGRSKLLVEQILEDLAHSDERWSIGVLRYFNPVGAHPSGLIGEDPKGIPNNLLPYVSQVAVGKLPRLKVFGNDYPTSDGTGVRDYIHVVDLVQGHLDALRVLPDMNGVHVWNLGTGKGYSVLQTVEAFAKVSGCEVPFEFCERREGDIAECWADPAKAYKELGWQARFGIEKMVEDAWRWQRLNPDGYVDQ
ncbi:UDP-glucose 4-epimerase GalE [Halomonas sp. THAF12]|uniref:UDP-glucose 4-epimerase GalE n=1 Tax=Halomonas sp. B23F22_10 TaxID=3459515 RepID=UPI00373EEAE2